MKGYRRHIIVLAAYILLAAILTYPLCRYLSTQTPGTATWAFDESTFIWNMWWFKFSLLNLQSNPMQTSYLFYPLGISLVLYTINFFNDLLGLPLQLAMNLPAAANLTLLFAFVMSGYGAWLLCRYLLRPAAPGASALIIDLAAFIGGAIYAFPACRMVYAALGHYNMVTAQWFPFYTLFFLFSLRKPGWRYPLLAALFAVLTLLAEMFFGVFLLFLSLVLFLFELCRARSAQHAVFTRLKAWLPRLVVFGAAVVLLWSPVLLPVLRAFSEESSTLRGWGESLSLSADAAGWLTPTALHPLFGADWPRELRAVVEGQARFNDINTLFLGYGILILAGWGVIKHYRRLAAWFWGFLIYLVFSLGPLLTINGRNHFDLDGLEMTFPMPFTLLHYIPILKANRAPNRFSVIIFLSLAVLAAFGVMEILRLVRRQHKQSRPALLYGLAAFLLLFGLFDQLSVPLPLDDALIPQPYQAIGAERGDFSLLQLPLGWRNSFGTLGAEQTQLEYYQSAHHKRMIGGNTSRAPQFKFDYFARIPLYQALIQAESYQAPDEPLLSRAKAQAGELLALHNIRYLTIQAPVPGRYPYTDTYTATRRLALELVPHEPAPVYSGDGVEVYRAIAAPIPAELSVDFGDWPAAPYRGEGWADDEEIFGAKANWSIASKAQIFLPIRAMEHARLKLTIAPFTYPGMAGDQQIRLYLNESSGSFAAFTLQPGWQTIETELPAGELRPALNVLTIETAWQASPRDVLLANTAIGSTGVSTPVDLEVSSGADYAYISIGHGEAVLDGSLHQQGLNMAVIDPAGGEIISKEAFDPADPHASSRLSEALGRLKPGQIVAIASQGGDVMSRFSPQALEVLSLVGAPPSAGSPLALIGVKGAQAGAAAFGSGEGKAYLRLGKNPDSRRLGIALDSFQLLQ